MADCYVITEAGFLKDATFIPSPNHDARPEKEVSLIVIHNISLPPKEYGGSGIIELFTNQLNPADHPYYQSIHTMQVSAHFLIRRSGQVIQFVSCLDRAWHAGRSSWQGRGRCNDFAIGIELEGSDFDAFETKQYSALNALLSAIKNRHQIQDVIGHSDIAPGRKTDPGPYFDWSQVK